MDYIKVVRKGIFKKVMIISITLLLLLHFNIESTTLPLIEKNVTIPTDDSGYGRTGTRAENGTPEGNFTPHRNHIRTFMYYGCPDEFVAENFDVFLGKNVNLKTLNPNGINFIYSFLGMVEGHEKSLVLPDYATSHGLTDEDIENMFIHAKEDVYYTLGAPKELDPKVTKLVPGWDPANDLNDDHHIDDTEFANRVNVNASARYKNESRIPIYYWGPPTDHQINPGDPNYQDFILYYFSLITEDYDGLYIDTMHLSPTLQGDTIVTEYPDLEQYATDVKNLLTRLVDDFPADKPIIGNGWYASHYVDPHPYIISGALYENWARIITTIDQLKLDAVIEKDNMGKIQLVQYLPIYHETANPNRPDFYVEGVTLERDQIYALALYYLIHGDYTYFGYGCHGTYHLGEERWFNAVDYDVGQPLGSYYVFDDSSGYTKETENSLVNGDFEIDDNSDGNPDYWVPAEPVELVSDIKYEGNYSVKIQSVTDSNNNINWQSVTLEPYTTYTLSGWIKTENVTGDGAQIYIYEFDDLQESDSWIRVYDTTDWTFYSMSFTTGSDVQGNIKYRIKHGTGTAWFDDFHLTEGSYEKYTVFGRDFENATVLLKTPFNVGDNTTTIHDLDGNHRPLNADGTLGTPANTIELMGGEGAILIKEGMPENCTILKQGWNLISIPLIQGEQDINRVLESIDGLYDTVQWYDVSNPSDPWKIHVVGKPFGNDLFELNEAMGFWVHVTQPGDTIFAYNGSIPATSQQITLHPGWNLVGYPSLTGYSRTDGLNNLAFDSEVDAIWSYNVETQTWEEMKEADSFEIGKGYWVHVRDNTVWNVPL